MSERMMASADRRVSKCPHIGGFLEYSFGNLKNASKYRTEAHMNQTSQIREYLHFVILQAPIPPFFKVKETKD